MAAVREVPAGGRDGDGPREPRRCGCELGRSGDWAARVVDPIAQRLLGPSVLWAASTRPSMRREASYVQKQSLYLFTESIRHDTPPPPACRPAHQHLLLLSSLSLFVSEC
jgi:hypothetical protein